MASPVPGTALTPQATRNLEGFSQGPGRPTVSVPPFPDAYRVRCSPQPADHPHPRLSPDSGLCPTPGGRSREDLGSVLALPTRALASGPRCQLDQRWRVKYTSVQCPPPPPRTCVHRLPRLPPHTASPSPRAGPGSRRPCSSTFLPSQGPGVQKFQGPGRSRHVGSGTLLRRGDKLRKDPQGFLRVAPKWA